MKVLSSVSTVLRVTFWVVAASVVAGAVLGYRVGSVATCSVAPPAVAASTAAAAAPRVDHRGPVTALPAGEINMPTWWSNQLSLFRSARHH